MNSTRVLTTPTAMAAGIDSTSVARKVTTIAQRAVPPTDQMERIAENRIAENPATIMIAASTGMGTRPTSPAATRMITSMQMPWKTPENRLLAPTATLSAL